MVAQLADEYRGRALAVIADATADPADIELVAGGQQGFEQQVTVIFTARTVAGTVVAAHQVEIQRWLGAWVVAVVHAEQADEFEGDGAHGHQGAKIDSSGEEALGQTALIQAGQPGFADYGKR